MGSYFGAISGKIITGKSKHSYTKIEEADIMQCNDCDCEAKEIFTVGEDLKEGDVAYINHGIIFKAGRKGMMKRKE